MATHTDEWVQNNFWEKNPNIAIEVDNVIKLKNTLGEAFWVIITEILPNNKYIGQINNHLVLNSPYNFDDFVIFAKEDIRDYKNAEIQIQQIGLVKEIIQMIKEKLGRTPTLEEIDLILTKITPKS
jgi:hypothetical protein